MSETWLFIEVIKRQPLSITSRYLLGGEVDFRLDSLNWKCFNLLIMVLSLLKNKLKKANILRNHIIFLACTDILMPQAEFVI